MNQTATLNVRRFEDWRAALGAFLSAVLLVAAATAAMAQEKGQVTKSTSQSANEPAATPKTHPTNPGLWNAEQMMEDAVKQIATRYGLNQEQEDYTRLVLTQRTREFLKTYEADIRELLKESIDMRLGLKKSSKDAFKKWAERAKPIYEAAMKAIKEGNDEWRGILDEKQKQVHDADLAAMDTSFKAVTGMLDRWKTGNVSDAELAFQTPKAQSKGNPRLASGGDQTGVVSDPAGNVYTKLPEDEWIKYLGQFIMAYKLDDVQRSGATSIHRGLNQQATNYRTSRRAEFDEVAAQERNGTFDGPDGAKRQAALKARRDKLEEPIHGLFVVMVNRLHALLTEDQKSKVSADQRLTLSSTAIRLAGPYADKIGNPKYTTTQAVVPPPPEPTSKPAEEKPQPPVAEKKTEPTEDKKPLAEAPKSDSPPEKKTESEGAKKPAEEPKKPAPADEKKEEKPTSEKPADPPKPPGR